MPCSQLNSLAAHGLVLSASWWTFFTPGFVLHSLVGNPQFHLQESIRIQRNCWIFTRQVFADPSYPCTRTWPLVQQRIVSGGLLLGYELYFLFYATNPLVVLCDVCCKLRGLMHVFVLGVRDARGHEAICVLKKPDEFGHQRCCKRLNLRTTWSICTCAYNQDILHFWSMKNSTKFSVIFLHISEMRMHIRHKRSLSIHIIVSLTLKYLILHAHHEYFCGYTRHRDLCDSKCVNPSNGANFSANFKTSSCQMFIVGRECLSSSSISMNTTWIYLFVISHASCMPNISHWPLKSE